ncbi:hypothetical protein RB195_007018 [Necator americanus]|uniref:CUE domain-containing protein n=1 Tax=Necator americanus TaxID=51031 RepID=A0ABR1BWL4_NECAM
MPPGHYMSTGFGGEKETCLEEASVAHGDASNRLRYSSDHMDAENFTKAFSADECVAWAHVMLPQAIFSGETIDDYYSLSGQQGEGKEGMIHLIISFAPVDATLSAAAILPSTASPPLPVEITAEDTKELEVMFPGVDREVIRCVLEESRGDKDATVSVLLEMSRNE